MENPPLLYTSYHLTENEFGHTVLGCQGNYQMSSSPPPPDTNPPPPPARLPGQLPDELPGGGRPAGEDPARRARPQPAVGTRAQLQRRPADAGWQCGG